MKSINVIAPIYFYVLHHSGKTFRSSMVTICIYSFYDTYPTAKSLQISIKQLLPSIIFVT